MARKLSADHAKSQLAALVAVDRVSLAKRRDSRGGGGLASLAGGWKGSADLVKALANQRRTRSRRPVSLDD